MDGLIGGGPSGAHFGGGGAIWLGSCVSISPSGVEFRTYTVCATPSTHIETPEKLCQHIRQRSSASTTRICVDGTMQHKRSSLLQCGMRACRTLRFSIFPLNYKIPLNEEISRGRRRSLNSCSCLTLQSSSAQTGRKSWTCITRLFADPTSTERRWGNHWRARAP